MKIHDYAKAGDIAGLAAELATGISIEAKDTVEGYTPLMWAVVSDDAGPDTAQFLLAHSADINATGGQYSGTVLQQAIRAGDPEKVRLLLDAGADVQYQTEGEYDALIDAVHGRRIETAPRLLELLQLLLERGVRPDGMSDYSESATKVASHHGRFDAVQLLVNAGADLTTLEWTPLMLAVTLGSIQDVELSLSDNPDLAARDYWDRTAWHLSLQLGDLEKAKLLLASGVDRDATGQLGRSPLTYAVDNGHASLLSWLIAEGLDVNARDDYDSTPLMAAVEADDLECVRILLESGADLDDLDHIEQCAMQKARSIPMVRMLLEYGEDLNEVDDSIRALLTGLADEGELEVSEANYKLDKIRRFGSTNPERMNLPFWEAMVRCGRTAWTARDMFGDAEPVDGPVWCYKRFGKSITELPDGRFIEIGGEHEDFYDPDFCIYNDVFVHHGGGQFDIYGYPWEVFPPTDFHTATLVGRYIYIVGGLSYPDIRRYGDTPVYRLDTETFSIEEVPTTGEKPGWISRHRARLRDTQLSVWDGKIFSYVNEELEYLDNSETYILDLQTLVWSRVEEDAPTENE